MGSGPTWHVNYTAAPPFIVSDVGNFTAFEIKVQAINQEGEGPEADPVIGYSGEDGEPLCPVLIAIFVLHDIVAKSLS